jgi:hypothetical protein
LDDKIANLEQQLKSSPGIDNSPTYMPSEPAQEISDDVNAGVSTGVLQQPEQNEVEAPSEGSKKKRRNLF